MHSQSQSSLSVSNSESAQVHKFGGSSLASAHRFHAVADILLGLPQSNALWVVVSAPGNTTDKLLEIINHTDVSVQQLALQALQQQLVELITTSLPDTDDKGLTSTVLKWLQQVPALLQQGRQNDVLAIGENVSALLLSAILNDRARAAKAVDARDFLRLQHNQPQWQLSRDLLQQQLAPGAVHVVTGYIAQDERGATITLGRNGSDYSATLLGALIQATTVTIWTDVKAIYSADPRKVSNALPYHQVNWQQAITLAGLGNPVLHARTLSALTDTNTTLLVRSSFTPDHQGCSVIQQAPAQGFITELADVTLLSLHPTSRINAEQLALQLQQPIVALPPQQDSQNWLVPAAVADVAWDYLADRAVHAVRDTRRYFALAWLKGADQPQLADAEQLLKQFGSLHRYENASQVIWLLPTALTGTQLAQLHQCLIPVQPVLNIVVAGTGNVGAEFLAMLAKQQQRFRSQLKLQLAGVLNSRQACLQQDIAITTWQQSLQTAAEWQPAQLQQYLAGLDQPKVVVDITPSQTFAKAYPEFIAAGCDVISANKQGVTLPGAQYQQILDSLQHYQRQWLTNTTCGAGIPVQRVLQELHSAGDTVRQVSGIFSGTLSWLLCHYDATKPFSDFVLDAQQAGLTEPDPRDDLSGKDVQRKLLVLARELGLSLELEQISLQPLLPAGLEQGGWTEFWRQRQQLDEQMQQAYAKAKAEQKVLRYVAQLTVSDEGVSASVELQVVGLEHPLAAIAPCDNIFVIASDWYQTNPLVLKGPGAGRVVTAGGLHADLAVLIKHILSSATVPALLI